METYLEFLKSKIVLAKKTGFDVAPGEINPALKPHQRDSVIWALRGGHRALFQSFGLGKTVQEIEFCHQAVRHDGGRANLPEWCGAEITTMLQLMNCVAV